MHHMTPSSLVVLLVCVVVRAGSHGQNAAIEHTDGHELQIGEEHCPGCMNSLELLGKYDYTRLRNTNQQQELLQRSTRQTEDAYEPSYFVGDSKAAEQYSLLNGTAIYAIPGTSKVILSSSDPAVAINLVLHWSDTFSRLDVPDGYGVVLRETTMAAHVHANPGDDLPERLQTLWSMGSLSIVTVPEADLGQVALCRHSMQIRIVPKMRVAPARAVFDESESVAEAKMYNKKAGSTSNRIGESCSSAAKGDAVRALDRASYQAWMKGISGAAPITVNGQQRTIKT
eukprot:gene26434-30801_t